MIDLTDCPVCGCELLPDSPAGLCPDCLLKQGFSDRSRAAAPGDGSAFAQTTPQPGRFIPPEPEHLAAHFSNLEILERIGHGGMGAVYKARQIKLDRPVALKIMRPESSDDPTFAERFNREARTLARLNHPNIVAVHDFGDVTISQTEAEDGKPCILYYFVMEYIDGANLRQLIQTADIQQEQALAIIPQVCDALQYAHDENVVHRDIKPENILVDKLGRVKIADFGLAKLAAPSPEDFTLTGTHQVMGTPSYMAPEQMSGSRLVDHRADIYSLGVVFYEMLTGELPMGHFEPPSKKVAIDGRLDEIVLRSLASEPERRYQQVSEISSQVNVVRGNAAYSQPASFDSVSEHWPGPSTIFENAVDRVVDGVRPSRLRRVLGHAATPSVLAILLSLCGVATLFISWGVNYGGAQYIERRLFQQHSHIHAIDHVCGSAAGVILFALALLLIATGQSRRPPKWRPWVIIGGATAALAFLATYYAEVFARGGWQIDGSFFAALAMGTGLMLVGAWDMRLLLSMNEKSAQQIKRHVPLSDLVAGAGIAHRDGDSALYGADFRRSDTPISHERQQGTPLTAGGRDWVTLTKDQVENDSLPAICIVCGKPASQCANKTFSFSPDWFHLPGKTWADKFSSAFSEREIRVACPVCARHRSYWSRLVWVASTGWLSIVPLGLVGYIVAWEAYPRHGGPQAAGAAIGASVALTLWIGSIIYLASNRIRAESITNDEIRLTRVSPQFARAVREQPTVKEAATPDGA